MPHRCFALEVTCSSAEVVGDVQDVPWQCEVAPYEVGRLCILVFARPLHRRFDEHTTPLNGI